MTKTSNYYSNGMRFMRDGVPCKVASWVADLSERSRKEFGRNRTDYQDGAHASESVRISGASIRFAQTTYIPKDEPLSSFAIAAE